MSAFITKAITVSGLLGGAGAIVATTYFLTGHTLGDRLQDKGHELLNYEANSKDNQEDWEKILKAYSDNNAKLNGKEIKVTDSKATTQNIKDLKKECAVAVSSKSYSEETSKLTEQYCVKPLTVIQLMRKQKGSNVLDWTTSGDENRDNKHWDAKVKKHSELPATKQIEGLKIGTSESTEQAKRDKFKTWCKNSEGNRTYDKEYHNKYNEFLEWCVA